jgi:hypothetical protein
VNTRNEMPDIEQALHDATHAYAGQFEPASNSWAQLRARADDATPRRSRRWRYGIGGLAIATATAVVLAIALPADTDEAIRIDVPTATQPAAAGPTTLAKGKDVELDGEDNLGGQTLNITAEEENGEVTGEFRITENVFTLECADTDNDGVVILGGAETAGNDFPEGDLHALIIKEGDPDKVSLYANDVGAKSCTALLESITDEKLANVNNYVDVADGYDIETA